MTRDEVMAALDCIRDKTGYSANLTAVEAALRHVLETIEKAPE